MIQLEIRSMGMVSRRSRHGLHRCLLSMEWRQAYCNVMQTGNIFLLLLVTALSACASGIPPAISERPARTPSVDEARRHMENLQGTSVRWGGKIAGVENRPPGNLDRNRGPTAEPLRPPPG